MPVSSYAKLLTTCEQEPINTPGAIQAHGVLLAVHEDEALRISQISANASDVFGIKPSTLLGKPLKPLFGKQAYARLLAYVNQEAWDWLQPITLQIMRRRKGKTPQRRRWDIFVHRHQGVLILEFEPTLAAKDGLQYYRRIGATLGHIHDSRTIRELCNTAVALVRQLTGFDRVMAYRFDEEWNGEVVAEARRDDLAPYQAHHFPASDIPSQARAAFESAWIRTIPDVNYEPAGLLATAGSEPLNLAKSLLRSVSPIHLTYLKNMGSQATLTITLKTDAGLWGLLACHHASPLNLFHEARLACELIGKSVSSLLASRQQMQEAEQGRDLRAMRDDLSAHVADSASVREGLWCNPQLLMQLTNAHGAAVRIDADKTWMLVGETPSRGQIASLAQWLTDRMGDHNVFSTNHLEEDYGKGKGLRKKASGLLAIAIPKAENNFVMWFRGEQIQTKVWAGDPTKQVTHLPNGTVKIEPRHSFEDWKERVRGRSQPWSQVEVASATAFRNELIAADLQRQFITSQQAIRSRDEFLSIASHELKTPLTSMGLQGQLMARRLANQDALDANGVERARQSTQKINDGMQRLVRLIDDMLDISRISTGKMTMQRTDAEACALARSVVERMRIAFDTAGVVLSLERGDPAPGHWDPLRIEQILWNLLSNALRYARGAPVSVWVGRRGDEAVFIVRDTGPGIAPADVQRIFKKFERAEPHREKTGLGLGLHICRHIAHMHGGRIDVESTLGEGTAFQLSLPCGQPPATTVTRTPAQKQEG